jgi:hypothetical protein
MLVVFKGPWLKIRPLKMPEQDNKHLNSKLPARVLLIKEKE